MGSWPGRARPVTTWRGGRVVDGSGLENRRAERHRGFESHPLRSLESLKSQPGRGFWVFGRFVLWRRPSASFWQLRDDSGGKVGKNLAKALPLDPVTLSLRNMGIQGSLINVNDRLF